MNSAFFKFITLFISDILRINRGILYIKNDSNHTINFVEFSLYNLSFLPFTGINANLKVSLVNDGCNHIESHPIINNNSFEWYILLNDDKCSLNTKIKNAVKANYYGIIFYPSNNDQCCFNRDDANIDNLRQKLMDIPVLKISKSDAETLALKYTFNDHLFIQPKLDTRVTFGLLVFTSFILLLIFIMCIITILTYLRNTSAYETLDQADSLLEEEISRGVLTSNNNADEQLSTSYHSLICYIAPITKFPRSQNTCPICQEDFHVKEKIRVIRHCKHAFHSLCLENWWMDEIRPCPVCRFTVDMTNLSFFD